MLTRPFHNRFAVRLLRLAGLLLALAATTLIGGAVLVVAVLPRAVSGEAMTVLTGSMEPAIPVGSVALVRPVDPQSVEVGDVVTYQVREGEAVFVTHRVVQVNEVDGQRQFVLQGDANNVADDPILGDRIRGEVWFHVPYLGAVRDALHGRGGVYLVASLLLAWFAISQIGAGLRERREERSAATREAPGEVALDRSAILVRLPAFASELDAAAQAVRLGAQLLRHDEESSTLLLVARPEEVAALLERIAPLEPLDVQVAPPGATLDLGDTSPAADQRPAGLETSA